MHTAPLHITPRPDCIDVYDWITGIRVEYKPHTHIFSFTSEPDGSQSLVIRDTMTRTKLIDQKLYGNQKTIFLNLCLKLTEPSHV